MAYLEADVMEYKSHSNKFVCQYAADGSTSEEVFATDPTVTLGSAGLAAAAAQLVDWYWLDETKEAVTIRKKVNASFSMQKCHLFPYAQNSALAFWL